MRVVLSGEARLRLVHDIAGGRTVTKAMLRAGYPRTTTYHGFMTRTAPFRQAVREYVEALVEKIPDVHGLENEVQLLHSENRWTRQQPAYLA